MVSGCLTQPCRAQWGLAGLLPLRKHLRENSTGRGKPRATRKDDSLKFKKKKSGKGEEDKTSLNTIGNYSHEKGLQRALSILAGTCARIMWEGKTWEGLELHRETLSLWALRLQQMGPTARE